MKLLTYEEYQALGGKLVTQDEFDTYELQASLIIENYCWKPEDDFIKVLNGNRKNNLKMATLKVIDSIKNHETLLETAKKGQLRQFSGIASESVKDHSKTFVKSDKDIVNDLEDSTNEQQLAIMNKYLMITGLLWRGM